MLGDRRGYLLGDEADGFRRH